MGHRDLSIQTSVERERELDAGSQASITIDIRNVQFSRDDLAPIVLALSEIPAFGCRIALIASQQTYPIATMISVLAGASKRNVGVFRSPDEAQDWLDSKRTSVEATLSQAA